MPNQLFSTDFLSQFHQPGNPFERSYIKLLSTKESLQPNRDRIEHLLSLYPDSDRGRIISLIQSFDDIECFSALAELYTFENIYKIDSSLAIEPQIADADDRTPDFVTHDFVFEVASLHKKGNSKYFSIIETINTIDTEYKVIIRDIANIPEDGFPKLREIREKFISLFNELESINNPYDAFHIVSSQGIAIYGIVYKANRGYAVVQSIFENYGLNGEEEQYRKSIRKTIKKKIKKYKGVVHAYKKLIIVLYNYNDWLDEEDFIEILFGDEVLVIDGPNPGDYHIEKRNVLLRPDQHRSVSAILVKKYSTPNDYILIENPYAEKSLNTNEIETIKTNFNCSSSV